MMRALLIFIMSNCFTSCTLSFTNVMTHGQANDVVDSTPTTDTKTDADIDVPLMKASLPSPVQAIP